MAIPTIIRSHDVGAPELNGQEGSLYNVFKWALPQLGWTIEYDDANNFTIAVRNNSVTGSGTFLRLQDDGNNKANNATFAKVEAYFDMSDINTGEIAIEALLTGDICIYKSVSSGANTAVAVPYTIIGTDKQFYFMPYAAWQPGSASARYNALHFYFFGDINSYHPNDNDNFVIHAIEINGAIPTNTVTAYFNYPSYSFRKTIQTTPYSSNSNPVILASRSIVDNTIQQPLYMASSTPSTSKDATSCETRSGAWNSNDQKRNMYGGLDLSYTALAELSSTPAPRTWRGVYPGLYHIHNYVLDEMVMKYFIVNNIIPSYNVISLTPSGRVATLRLDVLTYYVYTGVYELNKTVIAFDITQDWDLLK